ncbi:MAG: hypothetical protein LBC87_01045 [Fibromonadaceae bacterium]|jgi:hypothetical protein|nr:hypothetical protein [Fibromonadaceae bacterium]
MKKYHFTKLSLTVLLATAPVIFAQSPTPISEPPSSAPVEVPVATPPLAVVPEAAPIAIVAEPAHITEPVPVAKPEPAKAAGGMKVSLYGFLQLNGVYETGANGGRIWSIWVPKNAQDGEGRILLNVNQTRIGLNLAGEPKESGPEASGKFEVDFANNNDRNNNGVGSLRIRHAFGQVKFNDIGLSLLFGQTQDLIAPLTAPTINQGTLQGEGSLGTRRPMVRLAEVVGPIEIAAAVTDNRDATAPVLPAFQGSVKAKVPAAWAGAKQNIEFILSGHYASREVAAEDTAGITKKDTSKALPASWSGVASLSLPVISIINLSGEFFIGQNLWSYSSGTIQQTNAVAKDGKGVQSLGGWGAVTIKLPADFALAGGYGVEAIDKDREPVAIGTSVIPARIKNSVIFANLKYFIDESIFVGFEYANLATAYVDNTGIERIAFGSGKLNRFELVFNCAFK